jgi:DNA processing protein
LRFLQGVKKWYSEKVENGSIKKIDENDVEFPACLRLIPSHPKQIYVRGDLNLDAPAAAIVGARIPSTYGKQAARDIASGLARARVLVVSGMAPGIDTIAHQSALENNGLTIGVAGSGLDENSFYPQQNLDLARNVVNTGGCLVSEYPAGFKATNYSFPQRNRIISGLSRAVVIIEAREKSGSLITAEWARKQKKLLFAVPGSIYSANSAGCNALLKNGALPATSANDILDALEVLPAAPKSINAPTPEEQKIINVLMEGAANLDQIIIAAALPAAAVMSMVPVMELNGLIRNLGGGEYSLNF